MKKMIFFISVIPLFGLLLLGCGTQDKGEIGSIDDKMTDPDIEGYIVKMTEQGILVVSVESEDLSSTGGKEEFYNAVWASNVNREVDIGQRVRVWFDGPIMESYPGQGKANKVIPVFSEKKLGANLTEELAIKRALLDQTKKIKTLFVPAIKKVEYVKETDTWKVEIKDTEGQKILKVTVKDE
ncbi:YobA family protein [Bacillus massilinigeriensis]|uniref:YobA family protein n=1 Tax=Bacillus massilionigeriensis TaxID=1805475 RepID=UPI0009FD94E6|nr:YobA family protein [Bacillus massilionigeriensis]